MLEKNKHILHDLIREMPVYQPPNQVWEAIEETLSGPSSSGLERILPVYDPPGSVWKRVEVALDASQVRTGKPGWRLFPWLTGAAASLAILVWFFQPDAIRGASTESVTFSFSRETVDDVLLSRDWQQDDEAFQLVERMCAASAFTCTNPDVNTLRTELDELTEAKSALENALGKYGTDADLIGQLAEIERQRTTILKKMLEYFI